MKAKNVIMLVAVLCLYASAGYALEKYDWGSIVKNDIAKVKTSNAGDNSDEHLVYFFNEETGMFLNIGNRWGTEIVASSIGLPFNIIDGRAPYWTSDPDDNNRSVQTEDETGYYNIYTKEVQTSVGSYIGLRKDDADGSNYALFGDRNMARNSINRFQFIDANTNQERRAGKKYYYIQGFYSKNYNNHQYTYDKNNSFFLTVNSTGGNIHRDIIYSKSNELSRTSRWLLVTKKDLKARLDAQHKEAKYTDPADATFFISDQAIQRSKIDQTRKFWEGFYETGSDNNYGGSSALLSRNGKYWHAYKEGTKTGTVIYQKFQVTKPGWYRVTCDGFYYSEKANMRVYLYGKSINKNNTTKTYKSSIARIANNTFTNFGTGNDLIVNEGAALYDGKYTNMVMVYVDQDGFQEDGKRNSLEIGINIEQSNSSTNRAVFDNFQLKYCCLDAIVLDENLGEENANTENVKKDYGQQLILKRNFTLGKWNSFCLPVNLTKKQMLESFGSNIKMAALSGVLSSNNGEKIIHFDYVNPSDVKNANDVLLEKDKFYLIKPSNGGMTENTGSSVQHFYLIENVYLTEAVNVNTYFVDGHSYSTEKNENFEHDWITFRGSYINLNDDTDNLVWGVENPNAKVVYGPSYILKDDDAQYGFHYCKTPQNVKGFRCWIHEEDTDAGEGLSKISFSFGNSSNVVNSIEELDENTIYTVYKDNKTYNLAGQQVSKIYKGLVIKNGKKYYNK